MSTSTNRPAPSLRTIGAVAAVGVLVAGCTSNTPKPSDDDATAAPKRGGRHQRRTRRDGHDRLLRTGGRPRLDGRDQRARAQAEAEKYDDIELRSAEGTNDASLQISQVETFINEGVDAIVLLPTDGAALTDVAIQGDGGRHPGRQRRPRVLQPVRRPGDDPR